MAMNKDDADKHRTLQQVLQARIRQAGREIRLAPGRLAFDAVGQALLSELEYACVRGVAVSCLLDPEGARSFIDDHPALLSRLETTFRIRCETVGDASSVIIFDHSLAVVGNYALAEAEAGQKQQSRLVTTDHEVGALAEKFDRAWAEADQCRT